MIKLKILGTFFVCLLACSKIIADPGIVLLHSGDKLDSLAIHPRWLEKHLSPSISCRTITNFKTPITQKITNGKVVLNHFLDYPFRIHRHRNDNTVIGALSMFESSQIPKKWVYQLNKEYDFVVVPDPYFEQVYLDSGVKIPIFVLPIGCFIEEWLEMPKKQGENRPFTFFTSGNLFNPRKNMGLLIEAFLQEFSGRSDVALVIRSYASKPHLLKELIETYDLLNQPNIEIHTEEMTDEEYRSLYHRADCYVNISAGEGFSITPRQALAIGLPVIATDNTALTTLCETGLVRSVPCTEEVPYRYMGGRITGYQWNPTVEVVAEALLDVYDQYDHYHSIALQAEPWLQQYCWPELVPKWESLLHPKEILLGEENRVTKEYLMTKSKSLYKRYLRLFEKE